MDSTADNENGNGNGNHEPNVDGEVHDQVSDMEFDDADDDSAVLDERELIELDIDNECTTGGEESEDEEDEIPRSEDDALEQAANAKIVHKTSFAIIRLDIPLIDKKMGQLPPVSNNTNSDCLAKNKERVHFIVDKYCGNKIAEKSDESPGIPNETSEQSKGIIPNYFQVKQKENETDSDYGSVSRTNSTPSSSTSSPVPSKRKRIVSAPSKPPYTKQNYIPSFHSNDYELLIYSKIYNIEDAETGQATSRLSKVRFLLHKTKNEIFVLPSQVGRYLVQKWADTEFSKTIASLILQDNSTEAKTIKSIFGNRYLSKYKMRNTENLNQEVNHSSKFSPQICTSFTAAVKNQKIKDLFNITDTASTQLKLTVTLDSLKFSAEAKLETFALVISALLEILVNPNLKKSLEYQSYFTQVTCGSLSDRLDFMLLQDLEELINTSVQLNDSNLSNFIVCHKDFERYTEANKYWVSLNRKNSSPILCSTPSLSIFCRAIRMLLDKNNKVAQLSPKKCSKHIRDALNAVQLKCSWDNEDKIKVRKEIFVDCLEGVYFDKETMENYWKIGGKWYQMNNSFVYDVEVQFQKLLQQQSIILVPGKQKYLYKPYPLNESQKVWIREGEYNKLYEGEQNFIVGDGKVILHGIELFDVMEFILDDDSSCSEDKSAFYFHHVKRGFSAQSTRVGAMQVLQSASFISDSNKKSAGESPIYKLHQDYIGDTESNNFIRRYFPTCKDFPKFKNKSENATFVYAIAHGDHKTNLRNNFCFDFTTNCEAIEKSINRLPRADLEKLLNLIILRNPLPSNVKRKIKIQGLAEEILKLLGENDYMSYIDDSSSGTPTQKWFNCKYNFDKVAEVRQFKLKGLQVLEQFQREWVEQILFEVAVNKLKTNEFQNLASKMLILYIAAELGNMGFGFKIFEITIEPPSVIVGNE